MNQQRPMKPLLLLASLIGALFCLLNASGAHLLCVTQGCRIYSGYGFFGISFYAIGAAAFLLLFLFTLLHPRAFTRSLLPLALLAALFFDTAFLIYQSLFWPCMSCLAVAFLFGLTVLAGLRSFNRTSRKIALATGIVWLFFFSYLALSTTKEIAFRPWPIFGPADAPIQVFFSPECPACRKTILKLLGSTDTSGKIAFFPVAKNQVDLRQLARYMAMTEGREVDTATFLSLFAEEKKEKESPPGWRLRLHLLANKVNLARLGASSVPVIVTPYLPQSAPASFDLNIFAPPSPTTTPVECCSAFEEKECD